jgi:sugar lactone lactonase YvrE
MLDRPASRRSFLRTGIGAAVAAASAPLILKAEDKTVSTNARPTVVGSGDHTYTVVDNWAKLPSGKRFGNTHGVCEAADGRIFIHNTSPTGDSMCVFDPDGTFIKSWGKAYAPGAHGLQLRKEADGEFLYLAETGQHFVAKTDLDGNEIFRFGYPKDAKNDQGQPCYPDPNRFVPTNIAFHPTDGSFYVSDGYGNGYVHHYDAKGNYLSTFGGTGTEDGKFKCPHGITVDTRNPANPRIIVADRENFRLQYFTLDGKHLSTQVLPKPGEDAQRPCHFDFFHNGEMLIPDLRGRLTILDKDNNLILHLGENPVEAFRANNGVPDVARKPGQFCSPHQAIFDHAGNIYCVEWLFDGRVTKLVKA